jgi:hypothetical protein
MSRQIRFYLLPSDIERLVSDLRANFGTILIGATSPAPTPTPVDSPFRGFVSDAGFESVNCFLMPTTNAEMRTQYIRKSQLWSVDISSEVIEFSGAASTASCC